MNLISCGLSKLDNFSVTVSGEAEIPGSSVLDQILGNFGFTGFSQFDISSSEEFQNQGIKKNQIENARITSFSLRVIEPEGQDLAFLDSIKFFVETEGIEKVLIAEGAEFDPSESLVYLNIKKVELKPFITATSMSITSEVTGRRPSQKTSVEASLKISIEADISGSVTG